MNSIQNKTLSAFILIFFCFVSLSNAQPVQIKNAGELETAVQKLGVLGSVLYIAAHPDDENTALMAYLSKGEKLRGGYLSITRGDGGQNLIGAEKGVGIGILRTQELLQARKIDGTEQFFTRAIDFGYSKSPEETFNIWNKEKVLEDVVWVIRKFKPDVVVTRFPTNGAGGHGHHTASAILAIEAVKLSGDANVFPEQLKYVQPWKPKRIFWNSWRPTPEEIKNFIKLDVGAYNPLLGKSYTEIAAESRSMHKSQGFGMSGSRGERYEYFQFIEGDSATGNIFDGVDISWKRVKNGEAIGNKIEAIIKSFNSQNPSLSLPQLIELYSQMKKLESSDWVELKKKELLDIIRSCAGLWMEAIADDYSASPGDLVSLKATFVNRSNVNCKLNRIELPTVNADTVVNKKLANNQPLIVDAKFKIPESYPISQPYWLVEEPGMGLFNVEDRKLIGDAENAPSIPAKFYFDYNGTELEYTIPVLYRWTDRAEGEIYRPFEVRPPVLISSVNSVVIFPDDNSKEIQVKVKSSRANVKGDIRFELNNGWKVEPSSVPFILEKKYDEKFLTIKIIPPKNQSVTDLKIIARVDGKDYGKSLVDIDYRHIDHRIYFSESKVRVVKLDIKKEGSSIGYVMGSGDEVPDCLRDLGYKVTLITDDMLQADNFAQYDAIVVGVRAYNTRERLKFDQPKLMDYVKNGGTLVVQYQIPFGLLTENVGPYPLKLSQDRITEEDAKMNFVLPEHQLVNFPNKITQKDFDNWIQERGLYFANQWDEKYQPIFSGHDDSEKDISGGTLFAKYGKGIFIYTGLSFFRELPAGVPGAYRIFANMISAGKYNGK